MLICPNLIGPLNIYLPGNIFQPYSILERKAESRLPQPPEMVSALRLHCNTACPDDSLGKLSYFYYTTPPHLNPDDIYIQEPKNNLLCYFF